MIKLVKISLLLGLVILLPLSVKGESTGMTVVFAIPGAVTVSGPKLSLDDLGTVKSGQSDAAVFLKRVDLGLAPEPGQVRIFNQEYLSAIIHQDNLPVHVILQMGEKVVVRRVAACIKKADIEQAIQNLCVINKPQITKKWLELHNLPDMFWLSKGDWKIEAFSVGGLPEVGLALFKVVMTDGKEIKTINVSGRIRTTAKVYRALRTITLHSLINQDDFELIEEELRNGKEFIGGIPDQNRSTREIRQGEVLQNDWIQPLPWVNKDQEVKVVVKDDNVLINIIGIAKADGWNGDEILVVNPSSNKLFKAKVTGNGIVEVNL